MLEIVLDMVRRACVVMTEETVLVYIVQVAE